MLKRPFESATPVAVGQTLLEVGDPAALEIEAEVLSADAVRLRPGPRLTLGATGCWTRKSRASNPVRSPKCRRLAWRSSAPGVILDLVTPRERWAALGDGFRVEIEFLLQRDEKCCRYRRLRCSALATAGRPTVSTAGGRGGWW